MSLTTPLIFLGGIYRINYIPLLYHLIDLEHTTIPLTYLLFSQGLDSRSFPSKSCKRLQFFGIQDSRFWGKVRESKPLDLGVLDASQGLDSRTFPQNLESWIQENLQTFAFFGDSRFKIQDNFWGFNVCVCAHECLHGYWNSIIYIYMAPPTSQPKHDPKLPPKI